jgi:cytoskeletal protein RodZ
VSDHRRTVTRRAFVLPAWALVSTGVVVLAAAAWLVVLLVAGPDDAGPVAAPSPSATTTAPTPTASEDPSPEPTEEATPDPEPSEEATPEPSADATPAPDRGAIAVSVLNASRTPGLARSVGQRVTAEGWTVGAVGNWRGYSAANTVHYPAGREAEARLLADDLGIQAVQPALNGMSGQRLTIVLVGPVA